MIDNKNVLRNKRDALKLMRNIRERYWICRARLDKKITRFKFRITHRGKERLCSVCGWRGSEFYPLDQQLDILCPTCDSLPRQRLLKLVLDELELPKQGSRILHVSPKGEERLGEWLRKLSGRYLSIDKGGPWNRFEQGSAMVQMDLTDLKLSDESVDFVCCSHVLENIVEDHKALSEIHRVLAPKGMAALPVQLYDQDTTTPVEQPTGEDYWHVWHPGRDYYQRYEQAGFRVEIFGKQRYDTALYNLKGHLEVPICRKK